MGGNGQRQQTHRAPASPPRWRDTSQGTLSLKGGQGQRPLGIWEVTLGLDPMTVSFPPSKGAFPGSSRAETKVLLYIEVLCGGPSPPRWLLRLPMFRKGLPLKQLQREPCPPVVTQTVSLGRCPPHLGLPVTANAERALGVSVQSEGFHGGGSHTTPQST